MIRFRSLVSAAVAALMIGCGDDSRNAAPPPATTDAGRSDTTAARADEPRNVLFLGTSLTAGYGLPSPDDAYPALIQEKIDSAGLPFRVINAGVSGETSAGALRRVDWLLRQPFDVLVLETGANDMLRGMDLDSTAANIAAIVERVRAARPGVRIVLAGMMAPPNLGREYVERFDGLYPELAERHDLVLVPFLLRDVGGVASLNQADGIHPNEKGETLLARNVWEVLEPVLREEAGDGPAG
jgi:acyl-CoA thioesterase-1